MNDIVRAWKDESYRQGLSVEEQTVLPANPAGEIDLTDEELEAVYGAWSGWFDQDQGNTITNTNSNTASSTSTSSATGGSATATTSPITLDLTGLSI